VAVRLSCQLENSGSGAPPALGVALTGWRDVLCTIFGLCAELVVGTGRGSEAVTPFFLNSQGREKSSRELVVVVW